MHIAHAYKRIIYLIKRKETRYFYIEINANFFVVSNVRLKYQKKSSFIFDKHLKFFSEFECILAIIWILFIISTLIAYHLPLLFFQNEFNQHLNLYFKFRLNQTKMTHEYFFICIIIFIRSCLILFATR